MKIYLFFLSLSLTMLTSCGKENFLTQEESEPRTKLFSDDIVLDSPTKETFKSSGYGYSDVELDRSSFSFSTWKQSCYYTDGVEGTHAAPLPVENVFGNEVVFIKAEKHEFKHGDVFISGISLDNSNEFIITTAEFYLEINGEIQAFYGNIATQVYNPDIDDYYFYFDRETAPNVKLLSITDDFISGEIEIEIFELIDLGTTDYRTESFGMMTVQFELATGCE